MSAEQTLFKSMVNVTEDVHPLVTEVLEQIKTFYNSAEFHYSGKNDYVISKNANFKDLGLPTPTRGYYTSDIEGEHVWRTCLTPQLTNFITSQKCQGIHGKVFRVPERPMSSYENFGENYHLEMHFPGTYDQSVRNNLELLTLKLLPNKQIAKKTLTPIFEELERKSSWGGSPFLNKLDLWSAYHNTNDVIQTNYNILGFGEYRNTWLYNASKRRDAQEVMFYHSAQYAICFNLTVIAAIKNNIADMKTLADYRVGAETKHTFCLSITNDENGVLNVEPVELTRRLKAFINRIIPVYMNFSFEDVKIVTTDRSKENRYKISLYYSRKPERISELEFKTTAEKIISAIGLNYQVKRLDEI